jgi:hypothetical protein
MVCAQKKGAKDQVMSLRPRKGHKLKTYQFAQFFWAQTDNLIVCTLFLGTNHLRPKKRGKQSSYEFAPKKRAQID